jgi:cob(I)alamin adenosyltransferase
MFTESEIKSRIQSCEQSLRSYRMDLAEADAVGKDSEYYQRRVKELESAIQFWCEQLSEVRCATLKSWSIATA